MEKEKEKEGRERKRIRMRRQRRRMEGRVIGQLLQCPTSMCLGLNELFSYFLDETFRYCVPLIFHCFFDLFILENIFLSQLSFQWAKKD